MNILIVDDHQLFAEGMRLILNRLDYTASVTETSSAEQAIEILESNQTFDLVLIDLSMPGMDGISILRRMQARKTWLPVVIVSGEENLQIINTALEIGALGFIPKSHSSQQMIDALQNILDGDIYIPTEIEKQLDNLKSRRQLLNLNANSSLNSGGITQRQYEVLQLLAKGYSNKQIATTLFLTEHTVKAHVSALFTALSASNRTECVQIATRQGVLTSENLSPRS